MFGILGSIDVGSGQTYPTFEDLFKDLRARMSKDGFKVVKSRTHRNKVAGNYEKSSEFVRCDLVCDRGGQPYKCTATQLKTTTKKTNCPWRAKAVNRKTLGAWVLTVMCDQHNHDPRTPEPLTDEEDADADGEAEIVNADDDLSVEPATAPALTPTQEPAATPSITPAPNHATPTSTTAPLPDADTNAALAVAGVSPSTLRLSGETFHQYKGDYRRMSKPDRIGSLADMQLRVAAIYAIENEDQQRQERRARQERKQQAIEENHRRAVEQQQAQQAQQSQQSQQVPQAQHAHQHQPQHPHHPQHPQHHQQLQQQHQMAQFAQMGGGAPKHPFQQTPEEEQAQVQERRRHLTQMAREHLGTPVQQAPMQPSPMQQHMQQTPVQQTPVPVPQFGMQSAPGNQNIFRHFTGTPQQPNAAGTPVTAPPKRRGRPKNAPKNINGTS